jgi:AcrR family transcriptional regulator
MPRVSQDHLESRRRQILDAARRCFARNGFHATSMQDILTEANLSAGAVYRYFRSKDEIIAEIATAAMADTASAFDAVSDADPPPPLHEVFGQVFANFEELDRRQDAARMAIQVWSEAQRCPALAERLTEGIGVVRKAVTRLVEAHQERGLIADDVPAEHVARVLMSLLPGFIVQRVLLGDVDPEMFRAGLRALLPDETDPNRTFGVSAR